VVASGVVSFNGPSLPGEEGVELLCPGGDCEDLEVADDDRELARAEDARPDRKQGCQPRPFRRAAPGYAGRARVTIARSTLESISGEIDGDEIADALISTKLDINRTSRLASLRSAARSATPRLGRNEGPA
jgi:hypothetical protein